MTQGPSQSLQFDGERFTPECVREIRYEHLHRYALAADLVVGKAVLDAACGEGYGSQLLARSAASVTGVDISPAAIEHARQRYGRENLQFVNADCLELPFEDGAFDCIISFETLEHVREQEALLAEFRRVLQPRGFLLISSPDRAIYSERLGNENAFHVRELYRHELESLLAREFPAVRLLGQRLAFHSVIWNLEVEPAETAGKGSGEIVPSRIHRETESGIGRIPSPGGEAVYFLALCAAAAEFLPSGRPSLWLFDDADESVYRHYHHEIRKNMQAGGLLEARAREIDALKAALRQAQVQAQPQQLRDDRPWWVRLFSPR